MALLYEIGLHLYNGLAGLLSPVHAKARKWTEGRKDLFPRLREAVGEGGNIAWFHCASLGEFEQGRPLIEAFREKYPGKRILITFFSPSGYEVRKNYKGADFIFYLPIDTVQNAREFVEIVKPDVAVFIKYEFWMNYLKALREFGSRIYVVSAIFLPEHPFFKWYGNHHRKMLTYFDRIYVQDERSRELLEGIGIDHVTVAGDTRFDRVCNIASQAKEVESVCQFSEGANVLVAGSTWPADNEMLLELLHSNCGYKFVIAPHEIDEGAITDFISKIPNRLVIRYSHFCEYTPEQIAMAQVFILDTIGLLSSVYRYGTVAYIGGGFGAGIHNILEAATFGLPLMFGPRYGKFREAVELVQLGGAQPVNRPREMADFMKKMAEDPSLYQEKSFICRNYVAHNIGASAKILDDGLL